MLMEAIVLDSGILVPQKSSNSLNFQMAVVILWRPKLRSAFNQLLISLCVIDTIFLISNVMTAREAFGFKGIALMPIYTDNLSSAISHCDAFLRPR